MVIQFETSDQQYSSDMNESFRCPEIHTVEEMHPTDESGAGKINIPLFFPLCPHSTIGTWLCLVLIHTEHGSAVR